MKRKEKQLLMDELYSASRHYDDYEIVTDVGASMLAGFDNLKRIEIDHELKIIELIFID